MLTKKSVISVVVLFLMIISGSLISYAQTKIRIGTYDSRMIAIAYYNSKYFKLMPEVRQKMKDAKEKNDTIEIQRIEREMPLRQAYMHEQGFGKGSVCYMMDDIKGNVSELAKFEKLDIIVSKYELNFVGSNFETIDISEKLANLFEPTMDVKTMFQDLQNNEPVKDAYLLDD